MHIKLWGTRGSIATPGAATVKYGGNTSCVEVVCGDTLLIFDAGTGIRELGLKLAREKRYKQINLFISHTHWDHIQGIPFLIPAFIPGHTIHFYGPRNDVTGESIQEILNAQMSYSVFPVNMGELQAQLEFHELPPSEKITVGEATVETHHLNHPVLDLGYRVSSGDRTFVYATDVEPRYNPFAGLDAEQVDASIANTIAVMTERYHAFVSDADLLVHDAQYTREEYSDRKGWGHSTYEHVYQLARDHRVRQACFFHHDPMRSDEQLEKIEQEYAARAEADGFVCQAAREGAEFTL